MRAHRTLARAPTLSPYPRPQHQGATLQQRRHASLGLAAPSPTKLDSIVKLQDMRELDSLAIVGLWSECALLATVLKPSLPCRSGAWASQGCVWREGA